MKTVILSLLLATLCVAGAAAQTVFAPNGAQWYHDTNEGVYHCFTDGDSTILGRTVSVIRQKFISIGISTSNTDLPTIYTYTVPDTVYVYNTIHNRFTPLYIFAVSDGDTVTIPCFYAPGVGSVDSSFTFRVDSVRTDFYGLVPLLTVYTTALDTPAGGVRSTYGPINNQQGAYAQRLGCVNGGLYPSCIGCGVIPEAEACNCPTEVTCYKDTAMDIIMPMSGMCVPMVSILDEQLLSVTKAYPNPVNNVLTISAPIGANIKLMSMEGSVMMSVCAQKTTTKILADDMPEGVYMLHIAEANRATKIFKIVINHGVSDDGNY